MPSVPSVLSTTSDTRDYASPPDTSAPAAAERPNVPAKTRDPIVRRMANRLRRALETSYYYRSFDRPDLIEDDYFRFRNQPRD
jgi:hypothetical protein